MKRTMMLLAITLAGCEAAQPQRPALQTGSPHSTRFDYIGARVWAPMGRLARLAVLCGLRTEEWNSRINRALGDASDGAARGVAQGSASRAYFAALLNEGSRIGGDEAARAEYRQHGDRACTEVQSDPLMRTLDDGAAVARSSDLARLPEGTTQPRMLP